jgi:argininosuccinate synthase
VKQISDTPDEPIEVVVGFDRGVPVSLDGTMKSGVELIAILNDMAGEHGVGRIDHVENRLVGIKSREVYETPAAIVLHTALKALETSTMSREQQRVKDNLSAIYSDMVYDGRWFTELRRNIAAFMDSAHEYSTGEVRLRLHKGSCLVVGRRSPFSLYDFDLATYSTTDSFDHEAATGFIDIYSLSARTQKSGKWLGHFFWSALSSLCDELIARKCGRILPDYVKYPACNDNVPRSTNLYMRQRQLKDSFK